MPLASLEFNTAMERLADALIPLVSVFWAGSWRSQGIEMRKQETLNAFSIAFCQIFWKLEAA